MLSGQARSLTGCDRELSPQAARPAGGGKHPPLRCARPAERVREQLFEVVIRSQARAPRGLAAAEVR